MSSTGLYSMRTSTSSTKEWRFIPCAAAQLTVDLRAILHGISVLHKASLHIIGNLVDQRLHIHSFRLLCSPLRLNQLCAGIHDRLAASEQLRIHSQKALKLLPETLASLIIPAQFLDSERDDVLGLALLDGLGDRDGSLREQVLQDILAGLCELALVPGQSPGERSHGELDADTAQGKI